MKIIYDKNFSYLLGILWADGFISRKRTILEIVEEDAKDILDNIKEINFLNICTMSRKRKNRKPQMSIYFCNVKFYDIYQSLYFLNKSERSPLELIKNIPSELRSYFYLGLVDGDGCFYSNNKIKQFYITSSFNQDWSHIIDIFNSLDILQYEIRRIVSKNGNKSSYIRIKKYDEILKLYNYLYPIGYEIGLKRKFEKCKSIIENKPKYSSNKSKINIDELKIKIDDGLSIIELSKIYSCNWRKIYEICKKNKIAYSKGFFKDLNKGNKF